MISGSVNLVWYQVMGIYPELYSHSKDSTPGMVATVGGVSSSFESALTLALVQMTDGASKELEMRSEDMGDCLAAGRQ